MVHLCFLSDVGKFLKDRQVFVTPHPRILAMIVGCPLCDSFGYRREEGEFVVGSKDLFLDFSLVLLKIRDPGYSAEVSNLCFADAEVAYH